MGGKELTGKTPLHILINKDVADIRGLGLKELLETRGSTVIKQKVLLEWCFSEVCVSTVLTCSQRTGVHVKFQ